MTLRHVVVFALALATLGGAACDGCNGCEGCNGDTDVIATLERAQGLVEADVAEPPVRFERAEQGHEFKIGDAVRTARAARADLTLAGGGILHIEPSSLVRFSATPGASRQVGIGVEVGGAEVEATEESQVAFSTRFGATRLTPGSRVRISSGASARFEVVVGLALVDTARGPVTLEAGDRFVVQVGGAVLERHTRTPPPDAGRPRSSPPPLDAGAPSAAGSSPDAPDASAAPAPDDATDAGSPPDGAALGGAVDPAAALVGADTGPADVSISVGDTATIHDPGAPTAVRFLIGERCTTGGVVEVSRSGPSFTRPLRQPFAAGARASATLTVPNGRHPYRVRCGEGAPVATGALRISRDAGTATLPTRAPRTTVDADGRRYTVLYQTLLPIITLRWPRAPAAPGYVISVQRAGGRPEETRATLPEQAFPGGRFEDGSYTFAFRTADGRARTASTSLVIDFDNASPAAHVAAPPPDAPVAGGVAIAGTAGEGAAVSVGGSALTSDRSGRFSGHAAPAAGEQCLAIRVADPQRGVHYFLRCGGS
jgi:hypothetical protein